MKQSALQLAVLSALGLLSSEAMATGFVSLPATGFILTGGAITPYIPCNMTGNYGSDESTPPTTLANNTCAVFSGDSVISTLIASAIGTTITYSGVAVATIDQAVWSNSLTGSSQACIYGVRFSMLNNLYNGTDTLNINGIALSGFGSFTAANSVQAAYRSSLGDEVVFRIGRTYTSVQHRATLTSPSIAASGYVDRPTTASSTPSNAITGVSTYSTVSLAVPTQAQQSAAIAPNWVEFTTDVNYDDADGTTYANSSQLYVKVTGTGACPAVVSGSISKTANAYSLRQTGQETTPWVEFKIPGYIPAAGNTTVPSP